MANQDFIDTSVFPPINAPADYPWIDWLNQLYPYAGNESVNPLLKDNEQGKTINQLTTIPDFSILSAVGDKRFSLGHMISAVFSVYLPKIELYREVSQAGGCKIIDNYICNSDGIKIKQVTTNCPANVSNPLQIIQPQEIIEFVKTTYQNSVNNDINAFVNYLTVNFLNKGYTADVFVVNGFPFFYIEVKNNIDTQYFKYYYNELNQLCIALNTTPQPIDPTKVPLDATIALRSPIPIYNTPKIG